MLNFIRMVKVIKFEVMGKLDFKIGDMGISATPYPVEQTHLESKLLLKVMRRNALASNIIL